ncbi:Hypothetical protein, putative [Bodo saltans]|uniref:Nucleotidyltransferase n=1 Tax=Bodo saltans TaxID=75058 RepID=A0A0S4JKN6_BODSA|nr:Hypothetical protein, putative [Bodo saltans]|eukprot:CUG92073.1 Hypothetical protein, putative [Bodo saltans]
MLSLPRRTNDSTLLEWASDVSPMGTPSSQCMNEFIEGICARIDGYWPDHQVTPQCAAYTTAHGGGELDLLFLVPRQDPIRAIQVISDVLRYEHGARLPPTACYWPYSGDESTSTFVMDVTTAQFEGFLTVTCDATYFDALRMAAEDTMGDGHDDASAEATMRVHHLSRFLRKWRRSAAGLEGSFVAVSVLDTIANHIARQQPPSPSSHALLVKHSLAVLEDAGSIRSVLGRQFSCHDDELWRSIGELAATTKKYLFPADMS